MGPILPVPRIDPWPHHSHNQTRGPGFNDKVASVLKPALDKMNLSPRLQRLLGLALLLALLLAAVQLVFGLVVVGREFSAAPPPKITWSSPNLLVDRARLDAIKAAVQKNDPVLTPAFQDLVRTAEGMLADAPNPILGDLMVPGFYTAGRETQQRITRQLRTDARKSHALALAHALTGRAEFADKSRAILFAWMNSLKRPVNGGHWWEVFWLGHRGDTPLVISYSFPAFLYAFDLLKGENMLRPVEMDAFRAWLRPYVDYLSGEVLYKNNHHNWQVVFLLCAAHVLEDPALFDRAVGYYRNGLRGQIRGDGALPRELWRKEKCGTYTLMALEGMVQAVHIAEQHGYDRLRTLRSNKGGTLEKALDFYLQYLKDPAAWAKHTNAPKLNAPNDPSDWGYVFEVPYAWWRNPDYLPYMQKRPYGYAVERCYTLDFATLLFAGR